MITKSLLAHNSMITKSSLVRRHRKSEQSSKAQLHRAKDLIETELELRNRRISNDDADAMRTWRCGCYSDVTGITMFEKK